MANRQFTVSARITADTNNAVRNTRALAQAEQELATKLTDLRAKFDAGEISASRFVRQQARLEAQSRRLSSGLSGIGPAAASGAAAFRSLTSAALGLGAGLVGVNALARGLGAIVNAASEQEAATAALRQQFAALGDEADSVVAALDSQAASLQKLTQFGDDTVTQAQARIAAFTKETAAIELLTKAATNFAAAKGIELSRAAELIAKTFASSTNSLSRYGIAVEGAAGSTDRLQSLVIGLGGAFAGQAEAQAQTFTGTMSRLKNAISDAAEQVGFYITENERLGGHIESVISSLQRSAAAWQELREGSKTAQDALENSSQVFERQQIEMIETLRALEQVKLATSALAEETRRLASAQSEAIADSDRFIASLDRLGINLAANVNAEIADHNRLLEMASDLYRSGEITARDLALIQDRVAEAVAKANSELSTSAKSSESASAGYSTAADSLSRLNEESESLAVTGPTVRSELARSAEQARITAAAFDRLAASVGRAAAVQAAIAGGGARLTQGGTRIQLPGGGSRLTRDPGLSTGFPISTRSSGLG